MADDGAPPDLEPRSPTLADLRDLCRVLNEHGAKYVVIGGFAVRAAGYSRNTMDIDLIVATDPDNEQRVLTALATLPDHAARELEIGEIDRYTVVRVRLLHDSNEPVVQRGRQTPRNGHCVSRCFVL